MVRDFLMGSEFWTENLVVDLLRQGDARGFQRMVGMIRSQSDQQVFSCMDQEELNFSAGVFSWT